MATIIRKTTLTQLTAPGATAWQKLIEGANHKAFKVTVGTIDTSLVLRVEYSDAASPTTAEAVSQDLTVTANGTYVLPIYPGFEHVRCNFVSEVGGTNATVDVTFVEL